MDIEGIMLKQTEATVIESMITPQEMGVLRSS